MSLSRRSFLVKASASALAAASPARLVAAAADAGLFEARAARVQLAPPGYPETEVWTVGGTMPGAMLKVTQGGRVTRRLRNALPQPTSIHWHGTRIANAMDGVPGLTQATVASGA